MTPSIILFGVLVALLASALVLYVANVRLVFRELGRSRGAISLIPFATPVLAFQAGARALPIAFAVCAALHVVLTITAAQ